MQLAEARKKIRRLNLSDEEKQLRHNTQMKKWRKENPAEAKLVGYRYRIKNPYKIKEFNKKSADKRNSTPELKEKYRKYLREKHLNRKFGLSIEEYDKIFIKQNGNCSICGINRSKLNRNLAVDHNHSTGKIRDLLCTKCNTILGGANDDINILQKAIIYLRKHA